MRAQNRLNKPAVGCIALISDGRGLGAPLDYAIDTCSREGAGIDLLVHGAVDPAHISALGNHIRTAGPDCDHIRRGARPVDAITAYIRSHRFLMFLVARRDDNTIRVQVDEVTPGGVGLPVQLVFIGILIEERRGFRAGARSVA
jgi:hypothetical protein